MTPAQCPTVMALRQRHRPQGGTPTSNMAAWGSRQQRRAQDGGSALNTATWGLRQWWQHPQYGTPALNTTTWASRWRHRAEDSISTSNNSQVLKTMTAPPPQMPRHGAWDDGAGLKVASLPRTRQSGARGDNGALKLAPPLSRKKTLKHSGYVKQSSLRYRDLSLIGQSSVVCISYGLFKLNLTRIELFHKTQTLVYWRDTSNISNSSSLW
jgi:hypothetical protein